MLNRNETKRRSTCQVQGYGALQVQIHLLEYKYGDLDVNWETWFKEEYREVGHGNGFYLCCKYLISE